MIDFCAIDFETATHERHSACELGICVVSNGNIIERKTWLLKPPSFPYFNPHNVAVHGIEAKDVANAPSFGDIWYEVNDYLQGQLMIAHNASFDASVLRGCLDYYGIFKPKLDYLCSIQIAKKSWKNLPKYGLASLAEYHNLTFNHHRAGDDAAACAKVALLGFEEMNLESTDDIKKEMLKNLKLL